MTESRRQLADKIIGLGLKIYSLKSFRRFPDILSGIFAETKFLDESASISERIYCILNDIRERKVCPVCHIGFLKFSRNLKRYHETGCCPKCSKNNPAVKEKTEKTCIGKYGFKSHNCSQLVKDKKSQNNLAKYGVENPSQIPEVRERRNWKMLEKLGSRCSLTNPSVRRKTLKTLKEKYGCETNISQSAEIRRKTHRKFLYDDRYFDSAPELAYYIWLKDNCINFEYQPDIGFDYEFDGKKRKYFPDFKVGGKYVEIKGDQFLTEDGKWRNPYRNPKWSDVQYAAECAKYEAKRQCAVANGVRIMYSADYSAYIRYVSGKYGREYLRKFKTGSQE